MSGAVVAEGPRPSPLAGVRILAVEQYGAGPLGTLYLADLGADVIKIEDPATGGDVSRTIPPGRAGDTSLFFEAFNRGKRSLALDLKHPDDRAFFERLVPTADAVFNNLRGDQPDRLGLTYARLGQLNPAIVCASLSAYGRSGPLATLPGYDALVQAGAGWAALTGEPDGPPSKSGLPLADYVAGLTLALGTLALILAARVSGRGGDVDTNLYDSSLAMLTYPAAWLLSAGYEHVRRPGGGHGSVVPFQFFATVDGHLAIAAPKEKFFRALAVAIGLPGLGDDPRFADVEARLAHRDELLELLSARFAEDTTEAWLAKLRGRVPVAPVRSIREALDANELRDRGMLAEYDHPLLGRVRAVGTPLGWTGQEPVVRPGPALDDARAALAEEVLGDPAPPHGWGWRAS